VCAAVVLGLCLTSCEPKSPENPSVAAENQSSRRSGSEGHSPAGATTIPTARVPTLVPSTPAPAAPANPQQSSVLPVQTTRPQAPLPRCVGHSMSIKLQTPQRRLGPENDSPYAYDFALKNEGSSACITSGWVGVIFRGEYVTTVCMPGDAKPCGGQEIHTNSDWGLVTHHLPGATRVIVQPGKAVSFSAVSGPGYCIDTEGHPDRHVGSPYELEIVLPDGAGRFTIRRPAIFAPCDGVWEISALGTTAKPAA
jgi:hypothetical protein